MQFKIGQKVSLLYEKGEGIILNLEKNRALVSDDSGFDRWFPFNELVYIHSEKYADDEMTIPKEDTEPETTFRVFQERTGTKKTRTVWEIDLHIEEILESIQGMSNTEILMKQMAEFRAMFKKAKNQSVYKLIVIHGVGEGVLKNAIRTYLSQQDQVEVYDADFLEYGKGATAIEFHPNW
ncbi:Smr/MutS family protein [Fluviicola sp.]|jgi:hypothetical protein|uniref:Smr/MutS family protein n=1 Tax=Fluviicola sp. TaxID=1917219 RepID=UPI002837F4F1|nr:Smr/MutS family protein [Fluviicola sp.]MDR0802773.1 Smr/MutS family protein [Fluviicola sp.]